MSGLRGGRVSGELDFGPVVVKHPRRGTRVGYYDDDDGGLGSKAIVYFEEPPFLALGRYEFVNREHIFPVDTQSLWSRRDEIGRVLADVSYRKGTGKRGISAERRFALSLELGLVNSLLADRMLEARISEGSPSGKRVFISHSSSDKETAVSLSVDLANVGHTPWLDEWEIKVGESIPNKIALGIDGCDYLLLLLSPTAVESGWVEREWSAKYWSEVESGAVRVLPAMVLDCAVPTLLRVKKYADLRGDYSHGLRQILEAIA
ncbi:hypothetical protein JOD54_003073 [Actinokineospora baliensis]|uniref:toll/interleukin-1 receptor domain-containing protein n=1 Tax=Actinokineospora baliensis TaxID=547056 RepID=UPI00195EF3CB|nr:toll/interleukin-1 receptor domain-containing protein [Actinokineospora baliensis]MBM7772869.1 hypothetical protein [Actinokineospora baliensis]